MNSKMTGEDWKFFLSTICLGVMGVAVIIYTVVKLLLGIGAPNEFMRVFAGIGLVALAGCSWVAYALTGGVPPWAWARRNCERLRSWARKERPSE